MANNTTLNAVTGTAGDTIRDLDRAGVKTQIVALDLNPAGAETLMAGAMPVAGTFWQATQPVSGTVTANAGTSLNTSALALEAGGHLAAIDGKVPALGQALATASVPVVLTAAQLTTLTPVTTVTANQGGTWNIGTVTTLTGITNNVTVVGTGTFATQATIQAGTALIGQVSASHETGTLYSGTTALTPKFAVIAASASGATTVVAAVGGKRIRVLRWSLSSNGAVNAKWQSHVTPTDLTGLHYLTQFASAGGAYCPVGIFQTVSGEALDINLSAAVAVGGELTYVEV